MQRHEADPSQAPQAQPASEAQAQPALEAPESLKLLQSGFGKSIAVPFNLPDQESQDDQFELRIDEYDPQFLETVSSLPRQDRIASVAVYNQQYWFRLLDIMQSEYPLLLHLTGYHNFNQLIMDYLSAFPPANYRLTHLGWKLADFICSNQAGYASEKKANYEQLAQAASLEFKLSMVFVAARAPDLTTDRIRSMSPETTLSCQPFLQLTREDWPLYQARRALKSQGQISANAALANQQSTKTTSIDLTSLSPKTHYWAFYRDHSEQIQAVELGRIQYHLLSLLASHNEIQTALETLTQHQSEPDNQFLASHLSAWFETWTRRGWFTDQPI